MKGCPWQDLHPHWTASEAVVSALDYMGMEVAALGGVAPPTVRFKAGCSAVELQGSWQTGRIPRCRPGRLLLPRQASSLALSYPNEMDARPGLAPGKAVLRTAGSSALPCARLKIGSPSRFCPGTASFTTRNAAVTLWRECEMDPPVGFAPTWTCLQDRRLSVSATEEWKRKYPAFPRRTGNLPPWKGGVL